MRKIRKKQESVVRRTYTNKKRRAFLSLAPEKSTHTLYTLIMATTSTVMQSSAMSCSQQQRSSSSLSSRRISSSKRSIVSLNARKHRSASSSRKESVVVSASSAKIKVVGCGGGGGNAVNRMIEAGVSVSLHIYIHIVHSFSFFSPFLFSLRRRRFEIERKRF